MNHSVSLPDSATGGEANRRGFLSQAATVSMAAGLVASYGTLAAYAGRFLFSTQKDSVWLFVTDVASLKPGDSMPFTSPTGVRVMVTRKSNSRMDGEPPSDDFLALSSVCPHLGCRVHWEPHNNRFFCPCHNGEFDPQGKATAGPPKAANQELPRYAVLVDQGLLFIEMALNTIGADPGAFLRVSQATDATGETRHATPSGSSTGDDAWPV